MRLVKTQPRFTREEEAALWEQACLGDDGAKDLLARSVVRWACSYALRIGLHHGIDDEELESLARHIPGLRRARFWMTFSESYLTHLRVLENVGMTRIDPCIFRSVDMHRPATSRLSTSFAIRLR